MKTVDQLRVLVNNKNVMGFQHLIRGGESNQTDDAYRLINGGVYFSDFSKHPYGTLKTTEGGKASGAYQFIATTWAELAERYPIDCGSFTPWAQDFGAVAKLEDRGALDDVIAGNISDAIRKCRQEWTSLPGAAENSGKYTLDKALAVYAQYGGKLGEQPDAAPATPTPAPTPAVQPAPPASPAPVAHPPRGDEEFPDIPAADLAAYLAQFRAVGAVEIAFLKQADGLWTVHAKYGG